MSRSAGRVVNRIASRSEAQRLGKRGSYRLGSLGQQGVARPAPLARLRPSFTRTYPAGSELAWLLAAATATALVAAGLAAGLWFAPFAAGLAAGVAARLGGLRPMASALTVVAMTAGGWALAHWVTALRRLAPDHALRVIARLPGLPAGRELAVAGLPAGSGLALAGALATAALLGLAGLWLGRTLTPRPRRV